jgi:hypothetical protein
MSVNIPTLFVSQFSTNIQVLVQQKGQRLKPSVMSGSHVGKQASPVDQVGAIQANKIITRFSPMNRIDAVLDRRWVFPQDYDLPQLLDSFDKLRLLVDPQSIYVTNAMYAMGRAQDDEIIAAFHGTAKTGEQGATSTTLPAGQIVSVQQGGTISGLTVAKMREGKRILMANEVDLSQDALYLVAKAKQKDNLLAEAQIISTDFNDKPVLVEGEVSRFLGVNILHSERLLNGTDDQSGTSDAIPMYVKSGMYFGEWSAISASISIRHDLESEPFQAYCKGTFGATRLEEKKMTKIWCR